MSKAAAKELLDVALRSAAEQDAVLDKIVGLCSPDEFSEYKRMIGRSMGALLLDVINPIVAKYPDLKPQEMK
jgi:hypothetical protein